MREAFYFMMINYYDTPISPPLRKRPSLRMYILCGTLPFHLAQIIEPHISTNDHVQVAVPRVL